LFLTPRLPPCSTLLPYTTLFRSMVSKASEPQIKADMAAHSNLKKMSGIKQLHPVADDRLRQFVQLHGEAAIPLGAWPQGLGRTRSEEHTSELQSRENLVCRLLLE